MPIYSTLENSLSRQNAALVTEVAELKTRLALATSGDPLSVFIDRYCVAGGQTSTADLFSAFQGFCNKYVIDCPHDTVTSFGMQLTRRGFNSSSDGAVRSRTLILRPPALLCRRNWNFTVNHGMTEVREGQVITDAWEIKKIKTAAGSALPELFTEIVL